MNQTANFDLHNAWGQGKECVRSLNLSGQSKKFVRIFTLTPAVP